MKRVLPFRTIVVDSHFLPAGTVLSEGEHLDFFKVGQYEEEEVITEKKKHEEAIIKWILSSPARNLLLNELGISYDSFIDYSVKRPVIENPQKKPGDIDILICEHYKAEHTIAFQCKPVSVIAYNQDEDDVNKLPDIKDAVLQVNKQRDKLGFYKNYLVVVIKAYGRNRVKNNVLFRGPTEQTFKQIYEFPQRESLNEDVGIVFIQITQPTGKSFNRMVSVGVCVDKEASILGQSPHLTNRIREHMRLKGIS